MNHSCIPHITADPEDDVSGEEDDVGNKSNEIVTTNFHVKLPSFSFYLLDSYQCQWFHEWAKVYFLSVKLEHWFVSLGKSDQGKCW